MHMHIDPGPDGNLPEPEVSVVVPTYNRYPLLLRCLAALDLQNLQRHLYEVLIVDDGSTDGTGAALASNLDRFSMRVTYLRGGHGGPAKARNLGISHARGDIVVFTDDDCESAPDWLQTLIRPFTHKGVSGVEGKVVRHPECTPFTHFVENLHGGLYLTANMAYRRSTLNELGGFDEGYLHAAAEDWDLAFRVLETGGKIVFQPSAEVVHLPVPTTGRYFINRARGRESALQLYRRYPSLWRQTTGRSMKRSFMDGIFLRPLVEARKWGVYFRSHPLELPGFFYWQILASGRLLVEYLRLVEAYGPVDP